MSATRRVRLPLIGEDVEVDVPLPRGEVNVIGVLPAASVVSRAVMTHSVAKLPEGQNVSCKAGCDACCRHLVMVSVVEARAMRVAIERLPLTARKRVKAKFNEVLERLERAGFLGPRSESVSRRAFFFKHTKTDPNERWFDFNRAYVALQVSCPFLEDARCIIYADRPFVCREFLVMSDPVHCNTLDEHVVPVPRPLGTSESLNQLASEIEGETYKALPLALALEWLEHNPPPDVLTPGEELLDQWWDAFESHWVET